MKLKKLAEAYRPLVKIAAQDMTINNLYRLAKILDGIEADIRFYFRERDEAVNEHCEQTEEGFVAREGEGEILAAKLKELGELDVDVTGLHLPVVIQTTEAVKMSYNDLKALEGIIEISE